MVEPAAKRDAVALLQSKFEMSERRACTVIAADRAMVRYRSCRPANTELRARLRELANQRCRFGYRRLFVLQRREGEPSGSDALRQNLAARGTRANVKLMPNRVNLPPFNKRLYRQRNLVERFFNKLKHFRAVATRYGKRDDNYLAAVKLASARINESMT